MAHHSLPRLSVCSCLVQSRFVSLLQSPICNCSNSNGCPLTPRSLDPCLRWTGRCSRSNLSDACATRPHFCLSWFLALRRLVYLRFCGLSLLVPCVCVCVSSSTTIRGARQCNWHCSLLYWAFWFGFSVGHTQPLLSGTGALPVSCREPSVCHQSKMTDGRAPSCLVPIRLFAPELHLQLF